MKTNERESFSIRVKKDWKRNRSLYLMVLPVILFYILFHYKPMYGAIIAFQDYNPRQGVTGSEWVGFDQFIRFFTSPYFGRLVKNTLLLSVYGIIFGFPAPIILALLLNELRARRFKKTVQTITYLPHFISLVVVTGIIKDFTQSTGLINDIIVMFGGERSSLIQNPALYRTIYIVSDIWQGIGWGSIIYLSALSGVDQQLYEAASIDGAGRWKQLIHVTLPGIAPTIVIMLIMRMGQLLGTGYEKTILLYNEATYETADVIASYIYRVGILERNWSYSTAIGLFNSVINLALLIATNKISRRVSETSLW
ncbi:MAG: ABC transporter permease subunit [Lachnospiraceae bacterium]|nr:ABC transporter permease subunit [Lachnospiraceae bacterium]MDE6940183.1 ABC transporter permease subunit [Lachnospiraceae bacterium]MDE6989311.1 ABC transporter permease subunit [Lachnospiraceae bacterium]MDE7001865.1 ABC transporter permease subunit [Lachnospiraceae bacterium]